MASPQTENGHIDIANELAEALAKIRISGEEMQCLWVIFRKTYGWHKKQDAISLSQFVEMTGIKKPNVIRSIKGLLSKKIIIVINIDNAPAQVYEINKNYEKWEPLSKKIMLSKKITTIIKKDNASLSKMIPTKETTTKETSTKEKYSADFLKFYSVYPKRVSKDAAWKAWNKRNGSLPPVDDLIAAIEKQKAWRENAGPGEFRPEWKHPATWLNAGAWGDEVDEKDFWDQLKERYRKEDEANGQ